MRSQEPGSGPRWLRATRKAVKKTAGTVAAALLISGVARTPARATEASNDGRPAASAELIPGRESLQSKQAAPQDTRVVLVAAAALRSDSREVVTIPKEAMTPDGELDVSELFKKEAKHLISPRFLFQDSLSASTPFEEEMRDLEMAKTAEKGSQALKAIVVPVVTFGVVLVTGKILLALDGWMKQQERQDMEREMELTGTYVSIDAGDVDTAIDPTSGKNITIVRNKQNNAKAASANATDVADNKPTFPSWVPTWAVSWISNAPTDDDFWEPPTAREPKRPKGGPAAGDGAAVDEDDSDGLDVLDGLIG